MTSPMTSPPTPAALAPPAAPRLRWHGATPRQRSRWAARLKRWCVGDHAASAARDWIALGDGVAAYCAAWDGRWEDEREGATYTSEIPEPTQWLEGDESGTWGPTTENPGLLRCVRGESWPVPWDHRDCAVLRAGWGRIDAVERALEDW